MEYPKEIERKRKKAELEAERKRKKAELDAMKKSKDRSREALTEMYIESRSFAEFKVKVDLSMTEFDASDLTACKLYWLKKSYSALYRLVCFAPFPCAALMMAISVPLELCGKMPLAALSTSSGMLAAMLWAVGAFIHHSLHHAMMEKLMSRESYLAWLENLENTTD